MSAIIARWQTAIAQILGADAGDLQLAVVQSKADKHVLRAAHAGGRTMIKLYEGRHHLQKPKREVALLPLYARRAPCAPVTGVPFDDGTRAAYCIVSPWIEGRPLTSHDVTVRSAELAAIAARLHWPPPEATSPGYDAFALTEQSVQKVVRQLREKSAAAGMAVTGGIAASVARWFPPVVAANAKEGAHRCLLHLDLTSSNILVGPRDTLHLIDFEQVGVGAFGFDLALFLLQTAMLLEPALWSAPVEDAIDAVAPSQLLHDYLAHAPRCAADLWSAFAPTHILFAYLRLSRGLAYRLVDPALRTGPLDLAQAARDLARRLRSLDSFCRHHGSKELQLL